MEVKGLEVSHVKSHLQVSCPSDVVRTRLLGKFGVVKASKDEKSLVGTSFLHSVGCCSVHKAVLCQI
jgi:hypothetical protein